MIRVVLDANTLASGFAGERRPTSPPGEVVRLWRAGKFELIVSEHLRAEVVETFRDPYFRRAISPAQASRAAALLRYQATQTPLTIEVHGVATHPEDDLILATAVSAEADYLVTGDGQLQKLSRYEAVAIISELRAYTRRFFDRSGRYMRSDRREHWPWLLRFALTPPDEQRLLLVEPPDPSR